jgi:hypothetical protein
MIGSTVAGHGNRGGGALVGAIAGTALGAASDNAQQAAAQSAANVRSANSAASRYEQQATQFRRAMSACLEGRGYAVK